ncbi:hypothetical protein [Tunturiibacter lichenicola]|uniref:hypothetical protein n=1 Tax=Tunturiibacter lichenicola TaxID=2051959 RepID=UPI003D9B458B
MRKFMLRNSSPVAVTVLLLASLRFAFGQIEDVSGLVRKAVEQSTLDQAGTRPFHLKAIYTPSFDRDKESHRTGEVEIWWQSPTRWRREVSSPDFHQVLIVDGEHQWQKNDGDYFPDWLRELAVAIVRPVPLPMETLVQRVRKADIRHLAGQTNVDWGPASPMGDAQIDGKGHLALMDRTGLLFYTGGNGWDGQYHDFKNFHGRMIAYTVSSGSVEVTAKVNVLEDLGSVPDGFFNAAALGGDVPIETAVLDETELRKNLLPGSSFTWPALADGPLQGVVWTEVVIDRSGKIREMIRPIADNPGVRDAAEQGFRAMQFRPVERNGIPVQAIGRLSVPFTATRPAGVESFDSAKTFFERGRKASCLGAGASAPYVLRAEFQTGTGRGTVETGRYEDTWLSETEWKREAWFGTSHLVRSQSEGKRYLLAEGPEAGLLRLVLLFIEPIPAVDTMTESDWRIKRDPVDGVAAIRVFRGPEGPNGELEAGKSQGYWFNEKGQLVKSVVSGFELKPLSAEVYDGVLVPRRIDVMKDGKLGLRLTVKEISVADPSASKSFKLKGHEWQRAFTSEVR